MKTLLLASALCCSFGVAYADTIWWHVDFLRGECQMIPTPAMIHVDLRSTGVADDVKVTNSPTGRQVTIQFADRNGRDMVIEFFSNRDDCTYYRNQVAVPLNELK